MAVDGRPLAACELVHQVLDLSTAPAGAVLDEFAEDKRAKEATALLWRVQQHYFLLRPPEAREVWTRMLPRYLAMICL